jgi:ubiquinone/menaquinone biosynthesis C-methylase UbiE
MSSQSSTRPEKGRASTADVQPELIFNTYWGFAGTQALSVAVDLDLFSVIHSNFTTVEKISRQLNLPLRSLRILLDALVGLGFLNKSKISYKLTPEAKTYLVKGEPHYMGSVLCRVDRHFGRWTHLREAVRSGRPLPPDPGDDSKVKFFTELARDIFPTSYASAVVLAKKIGVGKTLKGLKILDVACGSGAWSIAFNLADPTSRVTAQDLPEVLDLTRQYVKRFRLDNQFQYLPGDLLQMEFGRSQYDMILLGHICHGIGEVESRRLMKKCFDALKPGGRLIVVEYVPNDLRTGEKMPLLFALEMLLETPHGDVFTVKELKRWLNLAGFKKTGTLKAVYPTTVILGIK